MICPFTSQICPTGQNHRSILDRKKIFQQHYVEFLWKTNEKVKFHKNLSHWPKDTFSPLRLMRHFHHTSEDLLCADIDQMFDMTHPSTRTSDQREDTDQPLIIGKSKILSNETSNRAWFPASNLVWQSSPNETYLNKFTARVFNANDRRERERERERENWMKGAVCPDRFACCRAEIDKWPSSICGNNEKNFALVYSSNSEDWFIREEAHRWQVQLLLVVVSSQQTAHWHINKALE